jgi:hypothetical protein
VARKPRRHKTPRWALTGVLWEEPRLAHAKLPPGLWHVGAGNEQHILDCKPADARHEPSGKAFGLLYQGDRIIAVQPKEPVDYVLLDGEDPTAWANRQRWTILAGGEGKDHAELV